MPMTCDEFHILTSLPVLIGINIAQSRFARNSRRTAIFDILRNVQWR